MSLPLIPLGLLSGGTTAFPTLRSTSNDAPGSFGTSHSVNLPADIQDGDLVILGIIARATNLGLSAINVPTDWDSLAYDTSTGTAFCRVLYIIASGAISSVNIVTPGQSTALTTNGYCFSAYSLLPVASTYANDTSANPNSPSLATPGAWGGEPHKMCISLMHLMGNVSASVMPSGYGDQVSSSSSNNNRTYSARRTVQSSLSEDPGAWTIAGTSPSTQYWRATTIGIRGPE
jgi:hypothetical protein